MFYIVGRMEEEYLIDIQLPEHYRIACSLDQKKNTLSVNGYNLLSESPIICSDTLQHNMYEVNGIKFYIWFQGECNPDWKKLKNDFLAFTKSQIKHFGEFPVDMYHFFFQILWSPFYYIYLLSSKFLLFFLPLLFFVLNF